MSLKKIAFKVIEDRSTTGIPDAGPGKIGTMKNESWKARGHARVVLELAHPTIMKSVTVKNAGSGFVRVLVGNKEHIDQIRATNNMEGIGMEVLVSNTQLVSQHQHSRNEKTNKPRTFRDFSRYVMSEERGGWSVLVIECAPFVDTRNREVGLTWVQVFGSEAATVAAPHTHYKGINPPTPTTPKPTPSSSSSSSPTPSSSSPSSPTPSSSSPSLKRKAEEQLAPQCQCGKTASVRKIRKSGPDFGKLLYVCGSDGDENEESCAFSQLQS